MDQSKRRLPLRGENMPYIIAGIVFTMLFFMPDLLNKTHIPYDFQYYHYPLLWDNYSWLSSKDFPLWSPFTYAGMPYISNAQAGVYYIPNYIPVLLKLFGMQISLYSTQFIVYFHFLMGLLGFYFWLQNRNYHKTVAFYGACLYSVSGYVISQYQHLGVQEIFMLIPFGFLCIEKLVAQPGWASMILLAVVDSMIIYTGFLPTAAVWFVVSSVYFVAWMVHRRALRREKGLNPVAAYALAMLLCLLLTSVMLLPIFEYYSTAVQLGIQGGYGWREFVDSFFSLKGNGNQVCNFFMGTLAPLFVIGGLIALIRENRRWAIAVMVMFLCLWAISFDPLAWKVAIVMEHIPMIGKLLRGNNFAIFIVIILVMLYTRCAGCLYSLKNKKLRCLSCAVLLIALGQLFVVEFQDDLYAMEGPSSDYGSDYSDFNQRDVFKILQSDDQLFRVMVEQSVMGAQWNGAWPVWNLESVNGFDPMLSQDYVDYLESDFADVESRVFSLKNPNSDAFKWLNVKYYLTNGALDPRFDNEHFECIYDEWYKIYRYKDYMDRYRLSDTLCGDGVAVELMLSDLTDAKVDVVSYRRNSRELFVENETEGAVLFLGERYYTGWHIYVNEQETPIIRVNGIFMGVRLPAGACRVRMEFAPTSFAIGAILSAATALFVILFSVFRRFFLKSRRGAALAQA